MLQTPLESKVIMPDATRDLILRKRREIADAAAKKAAAQTAPSASRDESTTPAVQKSKVTPLLEILKERLKLGPMPVSEYIGLALSHPRFGYYTTRKVFGPGGDFVTAPEISQVRCRRDARHFSLCADRTLENLSLPWSPECSIDRAIPRTPLRCSDFEEQAPPSI